jgi:hypothetical protein
MEMRLQDIKLVKVGPSIAERIAARYHRNVVRRLCSLRQEWEKDLDGESWTALEVRAVPVLSDVASALGLTESERAEVLGPEGILALAGELDSRIYPALSDRQLTALSAGSCIGMDTAKALVTCCQTDLLPLPITGDGGGRARQGERRRMDCTHSKRGIRNDE